MVLCGMAAAQAGSDLLPACAKRKKCGFVDRTGKMVIKAQFLNTREFHEGLAAVEINTTTGPRYGYIDATGNIIIPAAFSVAGEFSDGLATFGIDDDQNGIADRAQLHGLLGEILDTSHFFMLALYQSQTNTLDYYLAEHTREGQLLYRMHDLPLVRSRVPIMTRTYLVQHAITPGSLLDGATPESLKRDEVQLAVTITGMDGTTSQTIYAGTDYLDHEIRFGVRFADILPNDGIGHMFARVRVVGGQLRLAFLDSRSSR